MPIRKRQQAEVTRQELLETATRFFVKDGFEGTRVDTIAAAAGINKRMIYVHFGSKEALYLAVLRDQLDRVLEVAGITQPTGDDPRVEAEQIIRRYFAFLADNPRFVRLVNWEFLGETRGAREVLTSRATKGLEALHAVLEEGMRRGQFRPGLDVRRTVLSLNAMLLGQFTHQRLAEALWRQDLDTPGAREATLDQLLALVFAGIATNGTVDSRRRGLGALPAEAARRGPPAPKPRIGRRRRR